MTFVEFEINGITKAGEIKGETYDGGDYMIDIQEFWIVENFDGTVYHPSKKNVKEITYEELKDYAELAGYKF